MINITIQIPKEGQAMDQTMSSGAWELLVSVRGRSFASSSSSSSGSVVVRLTQEHRSRDAKKAETTVALTQLATLPKLSRDIMLLLGLLICYLPLRIRF